MVLSEFAKRYPGLDFQFLILATDPSPEDLQQAKRAIYTEKSIGLMPMALRRKYLLRSKDDRRPLVRIAPEVRELVKFRKVDILGEEIRFRESIDIIFCHDVFSHVGKDVRLQLLTRFYRRMSPGGYLFVEYSDLTGDLGIPLIPVAPTIYRKIEA
jgi:chemotaxis protein methyltransferase CheR